MDEQKGQNIKKDSTAELSDAPKQAVTEKPVQKPGNHKDETEAAKRAHDLKRFSDKSTRWITTSAIIQAVCTAFIAWFTFNIMNTTQQYTTYTKSQAIAENKSATAEARAAVAETTSANAAQSAANTAAGALKEAQAEAKASGTNFSEQLARLDASINAERQIAAADRGALVQARKELAISQANFSVEQRPWVYISVPGIVADAKNYGFDAQLSIANYGRSPAQFLKMASNYSWGTGAASVADSFFAHIEQMHWKALSQWALPPGVGSPPTSFTTVHWGPDTPALFQFQSATSGTIAVFGRVYYQDSAGHRFYTDFCMLRLATNAAAYCSRHNDMK